MIFDYIHFEDAFSKEKFFENILFFTYLYVLCILLEIDNFALKLIKGFNQLFENENFLIETGE